MLRRMREKAEMLGILFLVLLIVAIAAGGCGTIAGFGEDLTSLSNGISGKQADNLDAKEKHRPVAR